MTDIIKRGETPSLVLAFLTVKSPEFLRELWARLGVWLMANDERLAVERARLTPAQSIALHAVSVVPVMNLEEACAELNVDPAALQQLLERDPPLVERWAGRLQLTLLGSAVWALGHQAVARQAELERQRREGRMPS